MGVSTSTATASASFDYAMEDSFFATLKGKFTDRRSFQTQAEAPMLNFGFVEGWCNTARRCSASGYLSLNDFERSATQTVARPADSGAPHGLEVSPISESKLQNDTSELSLSSAFDGSFLPPVIVHLSAGGENFTVFAESR